MGTITIDGKEYIYCFPGSVVDLSSNAPRFCITYYRDFDVISIKRLSDTTFELKLKSKHYNEMIGSIKLTMKDLETFYFDIIDGSGLFKNEIKNFTIGDKCYFKKLQKND